MAEGRDIRHKTRDTRQEAGASRCQVFFRTSRGGSGIEYDTAKAEFLSVFGEHCVEVTRDIPARMRMEINAQGLSDGEISQRAELLGYTQGIVSVHEEPYQGEELNWHKTGRWVVGCIRRGDRKLQLAEIYRQDEEKRLKEAPHSRVFLIERDGQIEAAKGHRYRRGLSPVDARFMLNIAKLRGDERILDPFAGLGGILMECRRRNLNAFGGDVDIVLRPGLAQISRNRCVVADARQLPFKNDKFHVIITEPPFDTRYRQAVMDSMSELRRVVHPGGRLVLLIAHDMHDGITASMLNSGFQLTGDFTLRRHGKLVSHVLVMNDASVNMEKHQ
jgi:SAM-dependent methyltransferase